jgi:hypothetical protein
MLTVGTNRFGFPDPARLVESCRAAEAAGFDHFWFPDSRLRNGDIFINVLTAAQHTERVRVGTLLVNPVTRHPSVTAKMVSETPVETARRFYLMGRAAEVRAQLEPLVSRLAWMGRVIRQPSMPGPAFIDAGGRTIIPAFRRCLEEP